MIPIAIATRHKLFGQYDGFAFFIFIFYWRKTTGKDVLLNHERIHFHQQLELLFVPHWILYGLFYAWSRLRGKSHDDAYRSIPFEREAYQHENDLQYLKKRKAYQWMRFTGTVV